MGKEIIIQEHGKCRYEPERLKQDLIQWIDEGHDLGDEYFRCYRCGCKFNINISKTAIAATKTGWFDKWD